MRAVSDHTPLDVPKLIVITGPTASGKTALALQLARRLGCEIISADSRQVYRHIPIGTATPTADELDGTPYHNISRLELDSYYSAAQFEAETLAMLGTLWRSSEYAIVCGGSMMYVDALCHGIDELPTVGDDIRAAVLDRYRRDGLEAMRDELRRLDPAYYGTVDLNNPRRVVHAVELCLQAGRPYSELRTGRRVTRPFDIVRMAIDMPRGQLFDRINRRVDMMMSQGLEREARDVYHLRHLNALNTVGYKEMFAYFDGLLDRDTAVARIAKNTRVYAKKQLTWLKRDPDLIPLPAADPLTAALAHMDKLRLKFG